MRRPRDNMGIANFEKMKREKQDKVEKRESSALNDLVSSAQEHAGIEGDTMSSLEVVKSKLAEKTKELQHFFTNLVMDKVRILRQNIGENDLVDLKTVPPELQKEASEFNSLQESYTALKKKEEFYEVLKKKEVISTRLAEMEKTGVTDEQRRDMVDTQIKKNMINNQLENIKNSGVSDAERKENIKQRLNEIKDEAILKTMED